MASFKELIVALEANDPAMRVVSFSAADIGSGPTVIDLWDLSRRHIDLRKTSMIGIERLRRLARALEKNTMLVSIDFNGNGLDDDEAEVLADVLCTNTSLMMVNVSNNRIGNRGIGALADSLTRNTALEFFIADDNQFDDDGAKAMARALSMNTTLLNVQLSGSRFTEDGANALQQVVCDANATLTQFRFCPRAPTGRLITVGFSMVMHVNVDVNRIFYEKAAPLGDGNGAAGAFDALPNEMLCLIAVHCWPTAALISLAHTCRRWRDCALSELVATRRSQAAIDADVAADNKVIPIRCDQRKIFRDAFFED